MGTPLGFGYPGLWTFLKATSNASRILPKYLLIKRPPVRNLRAKYATWDQSVDMRSIWMSGARAEIASRFMDYFEDFEGRDR